MKTRRITTVGASIGAGIGLGLGLVLAPTVAHASTPVASVSHLGSEAGDPLPRPVDRTTHDQLVEISRTVAVEGRADITVRVDGAEAGATVRLTVNGVLSTAVADRDGVALLDVTFFAANHYMTIQQVLGEKASLVDTYQYDFRWPL